MTLTFPSFSLPGMMAVLRAPDTLQPSSRAVSPSQADDVHADRTFVRDLLTRNPEALQDEHGMMMLMSLYWKHF